MPKRSRFSSAGASRKTSADIVADGIRNAILGGELRDGEVLNQAEIAREFNLSRVPVREAIGRLQAEGLVSASPHKKARVIGFDQARMAEAFEIRALLEPFALAQTPGDLDPAILLKLDGLCDAAEACDDPERWLALHREFHRYALASSTAHTAVALVEHLAGQVSRYLHRPNGAGPSRVPQERLVILGAFEDEAYRRATDREHRELLMALKEGRHEAATELLRQHILSTRSRLLSTVAGDHGRR